MDIRIDQLQIEDSKVPGDNLEEMLGYLQENHLPENRVIADVLVNGESYSEDVPHAALEVSRSGIQTLQLVTKSGEEIARHFLDNGPLFIQSMLEAVPKITEMFRIGDETEANEHFLRFLESLHLLVNMTQQVNMVLNVQVNQEQGALGSFNARMKKLSDILGSILNIQEQNDWIYLADLVEYELAPELEALAEIMPRLKPEEQ